MLDNSRRSVLRLCGSTAALALLTACGGATVAPPPALPAAVTDPAAKSVAESLKEIASGTLGMLPKFGVNATKVAQITDIANKLFGISDAVVANGGGSNWKVYAERGLKLLSFLAPILPGGPVVAAVVSLAPEIAQLAGLGASHHLGRAVMPPEQAHAILRRAAVGQV